MRCPKCSHSDTKVVDSRNFVKKRRRRRQCKKCQCRFTTTEVYGNHSGGNVELFRPEVESYNGKPVPFSKDKIRDSLLRACKRLRIPDAELELFVEEFIEKVTEKRALIEIDTIVETAIAELANLHPTAAIRYALQYTEITSKDQVKKIVAKYSK